MVWVFGKKMEDDKDHWDLGSEAPLRRLRPYLAAISSIPGAKLTQPGLTSHHCKGKTIYLHTKLYTSYTLVLYIRESSPQQ